MNALMTLSELQALSIELGKRLDSAALLKRRYPDDQTYLESVNDISAELAEVNAKIDLYEASHRGEILEAQAELKETRRKAAIAGFKRVSNALDLKAEIALEIQYHASMLGESLKRWNEVGEECASATLAIINNTIEDPVTKQDTIYQLKGLSKSPVAQSLTQMLVDMDISEHIKECGEFKSFLILESQPLEVHNKADSKALLSQLQALMERV